MKTKTRTSLIILIAALLLLAIAVPVFARSTSSETCSISWRAWNPDGTIRFVDIQGEQETIWDGSTLTTICTGNIPLGEPLGSATYFDLDDTREYICDYWLEEPCVIPMPFFVTSEDVSIGTADITYLGVVYTADFWSYLVKNTGDFVVEAVFTIE